MTTLDASDLDQYMGVPMEPGELKEPVAANDIRRWVQGMHYPNPLHYDERWAAESHFGEIVAPQSFTVACDTSHGCSPAQVGKIPSSHLIFGGDDWWFFGPRIRPGDHLLCHRMPYDYRVTDTKFAGPTCFQRGDTLYINQRGERVALQRSTAIRYQVREAKEKNLFAEPEEPTWTDEQLADLEERKLAFIDQIQHLGHDPRRFDSVSVGDRLADNVLGPHSLASFTTEWRAYPMTTWGAMAKGPTTMRAEELGYTAEMAGFEGLFILSGGFDHASAEQALLDKRGDLIAFGRPFLANPDLVERMRKDSPLNAPDEATFYVPGARGYTDYPALAA